jgi:hypothetical protein
LPVIRSLTLGTGLFVAAFIVWTWWDGGRNFSDVEYSRPSWTLGFYAGDGMVRGALNTSPEAFLRPGFEFGRRDFGFMGKDYELSVSRAGLMIDLEAPFREIRMAAWMLFIPFVNIWVPLLLWSYLRRRKVRAMNNR